jgi:hypothetical protein
MRQGEGYWRLQGAAGFDRRQPFAFNVGGVAIGIGRQRDKARGRSGVAPPSTEACPPHVAFALCGAASSKGSRRRDMPNEPFDAKYWRGRAEEALAAARQLADAVGVMRTCLDPPP